MLGWTGTAGRKCVAKNYLAFILSKMADFNLVTFLAPNSKFLPLLPIIDYLLTFSGTKCRKEMFKSVNSDLYSVDFNNVLVKISDNLE